MAYTFYNTRGLVLGREEEGDARFVITILTAEYGIIFADARGLHKNTSRLKYALDTLTEGEYSLIRGKYGWRIVNARSDVYWYTNEIRKRENADVVARVLRLVRGVVPRDQAEKEVFEIVMGFLNSVRIVSKEDLALLEIHTVYHILGALGYVASQDNLTTYEPWSSRTALEIGGAR